MKMKKFARKAKETALKKKKNEEADAEDEAGHKSQTRCH